LIANHSNKALNTQKYIGTLVICDLLAFRGYESAYVAFSFLALSQHSWAALSLGDRFSVLAVELRSSLTLVLV
jgi:hypothetical protein